MAQNHKWSAGDINRRRLLQGMGAAGVVGVAGCLGGNGDDDDENGEGGDGVGEEDVDFGDLQEGGTLSIAISENVDSFDPPYSTDTTSTMAQNYIFETLVASDQGGNTYPWLAESYELVETNEIDESDYEEYMISVAADEEGLIDTEEQVIITHPDDNPIEDDEVRVLTREEAAAAVEDGVFGMQFQYQLREGIEFHDGEEFTAENVVLTAQRYENSDLSAQTFDSLLYAEEVDEYTVNLYAQIPDAEAESQLPGLYIHSSEQAGLEGGDLDPRQGNEPVGTGPYVFEEFADEQYYEVSKNENYWVEEMGVDSIDWFEGSEDFPDGPVIDAIEMEIVPDDATRSGALQNGEVDTTFGLSTQTLDEFDESGDFNVYATEAGGYTYLQTPVNVEPWDDARLRQAFNHLIPRESIVENVFNGWARPAWTDIPELAQESGTADPEALEDDVRPTNEYDPERAEELLEEAGDDLGIDYPIEVQIETNADNDDRVQMVQLIAESMNQLDHFEASVETFEWNNFIGRVLDPEYGDRGVIGCIGLSGTFNPGSFCNALNHSDNVGQCCNLVGVSDSELDEMIDGARYGVEVSEDEEVRAERYDEVWRYLAEERYSSITHFGITHAITNTDVRGFTVWPFSEGIYSFALYNPAEEQAIWLDRDE